MAAAGVGVVRVGMVSTTARWKGHEVFLRALAMLPDKFPVRGYVIGAPLYRTKDSQYEVSELRELADNLGLRGKVGFTGFVEDNAAAIRSLDIVVHASTKPEPFGLVIVEAMACARPVLISAGGGATEIFTEGVDALSYPPGDACALAELIRKLIGSDATRRRIGLAGRATVERRFSSARLAEELIPIYCDAISLRV